MTPNPSSVVKTVDEMLRDAGQVDADELRAALLELGRLASVPPPAPNAELSALLAGRTDQLARRRRLGRHRPGVVGLAVIAGMGLGVTGVAAGGPDGTQQASMSVQHLLQDWAPSWTIAAEVPAAGVGLVLAPVPSEGPVTIGQPLPAPANQAATPVAPAQGQAKAGEGAAPPATDGDAAAAKGEVAPATAKGGEPGRSKETATPDSEMAANQVDRPQKKPDGAPAKDADAQEALTSGIPVPGSAATSGSGKSTPGSVWMKKFRR